MYGTFGTVALGWLRFGDAANYWTANCPIRSLVVPVAGVELATKRQQLWQFCKRRLRPCLPLI